jgi:hypothetical protein
MLAKLKGVEDRVWVRIAGFDPVFAIADEDLERENAEKTSAVHFLRFELIAAGMSASITPRGGRQAVRAPLISVGVDPPCPTATGLADGQHRPPLPDNAV